MKKYLCLFITIIMLSSLSSQPVYADVSLSSTSYEYEYYDDGSYTVTTITSDQNQISLFSTSTTKSKKTTYYNPQNQAQWYVKVTGSFTYGNGKSVCTSSSVSSGTYSSSWKISSSSTSRSGNSATAKASANHYFDGSLYQTVTKSVKLTCSTTGTFS